MAQPTIRQKFDAEKISVNTAWMRRNGEHFEVVVDPDAALEFRKTKGDQPAIVECLHAERVFSDAKRGLHAKDELLELAFGTKDPMQIAKVLILSGELQLTQEHRNKIRDAKRKAILERIHTYAIDPTTGLSHPLARIKLAIEEAKVKIDDNKDIESQIPHIVKLLQPILPIRLETVTLHIHLPSPMSQKLYGDLSRFGQLKKTEWLDDGSLLSWIEIPAGLRTELYDELGKKSHGAADIRLVGEERIAMTEKSRNTARQN